MKKNKRPPVMKAQCATCPFRTGSKYACLAPSLAESALTDCSRVCHSTGSNNGINRRTGIKPHLCRGARDFQLRFFVSIGFLPEATDAEWEKKCSEIGIE